MSHIRRGAPEATIHLGGKARTLRYDLGALIDLEAETGIDLIARSEATRVPPGATPEQAAEAETALVELSRDLSKPRNVAALLWSMLVHEDETLTPRQVARWLHPGNLAQLSEAALSLVAADGDPTQPEPTPDQEATDPGNA